MKKSINNKKSWWQGLLDRLHFLFIPHEGNGYKPHILHPHRVIFHGVSAIVIKAFIVISVLALPTSAWLTPDVLTEQSQKIIALTNNLRGKMGLNLLKENSTLDQASLAKVQDMMVNQYFAHLSPQNKNMLNWLKSVNYSYAVAGENLAMGFSSAEDVLSAWIKSKTHYANLIDPDFQEIGVSMVSGKFNDHDTTMVAQYFATLKVFEAPIQAIPLTSATLPAAKPQTKALKIKVQTPTAIKGVKYTGTTILVDKTPPAIDLSKTKIWVSEAALTKDKIIRVEAYLSSDTDNAQVNLNNVIITLFKDTNDQTKWTGSTIIPKDKAEETFSPVVLATLTAADHSGNVITADINWQNFEDIKPSLVKQYLFIKNNPSREVKLLSGISKIYFIILLIIGCLALALNIFIEMKKQHPHIIALTLALICLAIFLLII